jgi:hypothetical protein
MPVKKPISQKGDRLRFYVYQTSASVVKNIAATDAEILNIIMYYLY